MVGSPVEFRRPQWSLPARSSTLWRAFEASTIGIACHRILKNGVIAWSRETVRLMSTGSKALFASGESPPADYDRAPTYDGMIREQDRSEERRVGKECRSRW